jgi:acyl-CoA thioester hydrolase
VGEPFVHRLRVRYNECDPQGVVFNANYLTYFDIAMGELWRELGGYQEMVESGVDMVVAEARIRYRAALRYDEEFEVHATVAHLDEDSMTTAIVLTRGGERVTEGELRHTFVETGGGEKQPIPSAIRAELERYSPA